MILLLSSMLKEPELPTLSYSEVHQQFTAENVKSFQWKDGILILELHKEPESTREDLKGVTKVCHELADAKMFAEELHELYEAQLASGIIESYNFNPVAPTPWYLEILPYILVMVVLLVVMYFLFGRMSGGGNQAAKFSHAATRVGTGKNKVTFDDVAGADEEKAELEEIVDFLRNPEKYRALGAKIPKGVLLVGPPGTGKTLLAKAVAGEADVQFLSISGSDFVELYVGVGAGRVRDLFEQAKKLSPCIVFIDEIDAVGRRRGAGMGGGHDEREQTLNQLLVEMDGFVANEGVIVLAATNRHDILDPALLRPGRFDRQIYVSAPDQKGREEILRIHARNKSLAEDVDLKVVAQGTVGFTGADLENLLNEAALLSARKNCPVITMAAIEDAILKVIAGPEKRSRIVLEEDRRITAYHEAGHAIATHFLPTQDPVHAITIVQRGRALGMTIHLPEQDRSHYSRNQMREELVVLLGGRVAEALEFDDITTGASSDLKRAASIARSMIARFGMSDSIGAVSFENDDEIFVGRDYERTKSYSEETAAQIDREMKVVIGDAYRRCEEILKAHYDKLHEVAQFLLEHENMSRKQFEACMNNEPIPTE
ncbi:MAG: ATP-dependent zinc metalloprotease FtsH [Oscillospiraceae bacterium]|nr:ATP-dependent zinc metalloprotease FtsH [Oscillospiraceae bacterium]